ncbi:hypothetical protein FOA52_009803 [Chlamydomonas sp. UWO 241]|nr:hypothetical protein FOA52_009803 [Chlamydomonas sp. UWO 241]
MGFGRLGAAAFALCFLLLHAAIEADEPTGPQLGAVPESEEWRAYFHSLNSIVVHNQRMSNLMGPILNYSFSIPEVQLRKGMVYTGSNARLRRVVRDLITGKRQVRIGVVGGSVTWGTGPSVRGVTDWFSIFSRYMVTAFPKANVTLRNGCVPGTPTSYMIMCLELSVDSEVDLVFAEYVLNDGFDAGNRMIKNSKVMDVERLARRILKMPSSPALVYMQLPSHGLAMDQGRDGYHSFAMTTEDLYNSVPQYYDAGVLSLRTAMYRLAAVKKLEGYRWSNIMCGDGFHPGDGGHKVMADLAVWLIQQTAMDVFARPYSKIDAELVAEEVPEPMYPGNTAPDTALCLFQDAMLPLVKESAGWDYVNEGTEVKPKKGYVTTTPDKPLTINVDTFRGTDSDVEVFIAHMRSYSDMGVAVVKCISGCACPDKYIDGWHELLNSQTHLAVVRASQHKECVMTITVEATRKSGRAGQDRPGTKFKVSGVMMGEAAAQEERYKIPEGVWGMTGHADDKNEQKVFSSEGSSIVSAGQQANKVADPPAAGARHLA